MSARRLLPVLPVALALAAPSVASATCVTVRCGADLRHPGCALAEDDAAWPSARQVTYTAYCEVSCAAPPDEAHHIASLDAVDDGAAELVSLDHPELVLAVFPVEVPGRTCRPHLQLLDHKLVAGRYQLGDRRFEVVGPPDPSSYVPWPPELPFVPNAVHLPRDSAHGEATIPHAVDPATLLAELSRAAEAASWTVRVPEPADDGVHRLDATRGALSVHVSAQLPESGHTRLVATW